MKEKRGSKRLESLAENGEKGVRRRFRDRKELPREAQCGVKHHLHSGEADPLLGGGPEPQEDPGKVLVPKGAHAPGTGVFFKERLNLSTIPLVVGSGLMVDNPKDCTKALPKGQDKLGPTIGGQMGEDSKITQ